MLSCGTRRTAADEEHGYARDGSVRDARHGVRYAGPGRHHRDAEFARQFGMRVRHMDRGDFVADVDDLETERRGAIPDGLDVTALQTEDAADAAPLQKGRDEFRDRHIRHSSAPIGSNICRTVSGATSSSRAGEPGRRPIFIDDRGAHAFGEVVLARQDEKSSEFELQALLQAREAARAAERRERHAHGGRRTAEDLRRRIARERRLVAQQRVDDRARCVVGERAIDHRPLAKQARGGRGGADRGTYAFDLRCGDGVAATRAAGTFRAPHAMPATSASRTKSIRKPKRDRIAALTAAPVSAA